MTTTATNRTIDIAENERPARASIERTSILGDASWAHKKDKPRVCDAGSVGSGFVRSPGTIQEETRISELCSERPELVRFSGDDGR